MTQPDFDVVVVGAGVAGSATALLLAKAGASVALLERGEAPGAKNLSGGVLYASVMGEVVDDFLGSAPIERRIERNQVCFLNETSWVSLDYRDQRLADQGAAVTVLRGKFDAWLAERAEEAGAMLMTSVRVDELLREGNRFVGVQAGEDQLRARVVVAADGVNSFLARAAGLRPQPPLNHLGVGAKALVRLGEPTLSQRFSLSDGAGVALALVGDCTQGIGGGGFLYTNRDTLSVGLVLRLDDLVASGRNVRDVFQRYLQHPMLEQYLAGGEIIEYGCHLVAEGGNAMRGQLSHDGLVLVGDAAGLTLNTGLTVRGMDLAAGSAIAASAAIVEALAADDVSAAALAGYERRLDESFVGKDLKTYARAPRFLETSRLYGDYGELLAEVLHGVFGLDGTPRRSLLGQAHAALRRSPVRLRHLVKDAIGAVRAL